MGDGSAGGMTAEKSKKMHATKAKLRSLGLRSPKKVKPRTSDEKARQAKEGSEW